MANRLERLLAEKNGGNQSEMARFIGVTPQAVQKWIAGGVEPRGKNLELAAEFLGVTPATLLFGDTAGAVHAETTSVSASRSGDQVPEFTLQWVSDEESKMLSEFRACADPQREMVLTVLESLPKVRQLPRSERDQG